MTLAVDHDEEAARAAAVADDPVARLEADLLAFAGEPFDGGVVDSSQELEPAQSLDQFRVLRRASEDILRRRGP